ncbi:2285_t:CDS:1 [Acaulospora morrowiae]|uniref:2285_t:CDS:1 n=1 Tax=Acaulospora morrowiae TaxID=94023 RepID=A0A9N9CSS7_9GLOM|nr:2285_t:CDS:1 [Acaulospora morrowiae]
MSKDTSSKSLKPFFYFQVLAKEVQILKTRNQALSEQNKNLSKEISTLCTLLFQLSDIVFKVIIFAIYLHATVLQSNKILDQDNNILVPNKSLSTFQDPFLSKGSQDLFKDLFNLLVEDPKASKISELPDFFDNLDFNTPDKKLSS